MSVKLPKTFKSKKQLFSWLKKNHEKLKKEIFSNPRYEIFYMIHYKKDDSEFVSPIFFENRGDVWYAYFCHHSDYLVSPSGAIDDSFLRKALNEDYEVTDELLDYYRTLVRDNRAYELSFSSCNDLPDEITILEFLWQGPLLDWLLYCEGENPRGNKGYYYPTIFGEFAHLLNIYSSLDEKTQKKFVQGLTIRQKAVLFGANPKYDIFNKPWLKEEFGYSIVTFDSFFTDKQAKEIYSIAKRRIEEEQRDKLYKEQRTVKGYSDLDVWSYNDWFMKMSSKMLKELVDNHNGYPSELDRQYFKKNKHNLYTQKYDEWISVASNKKQEKQKEKAAKICDKEWTDILNRMIFLLNEMNEDTCSMAKEEDTLYEACSKINREFVKQYGTCGSELKKTLRVKDVWRRKKYRDNVMKYLKKKNARELAKSKNIKISENMTIHDMEQIRPGCLMLNPSYLPKNNEMRIRYEEAEKIYRDYSIEMNKYREKCKNEFFDLMKKWFWCLWD